MRKQLWIVLAAAFAAGPAAAVTPPDYDIPYAGAFYTHEFADSSRDSANGMGFTVMLGMPLWGDRNALELSFSDLGRERHIDGRDDYQSVLALDLVHDFGLFGWGQSAAAGWLPNFKPYVLGGILGVQDDVRGDKHNTYGVDLGAGVLVPLRWFGASVRAEWRAQGQANDSSVPGEDLLIDYRANVGLQIPLTPLFRERRVEVAPAAETCDVAVVDPVTGRSDCGTDTDRDSVLDGIDQCPGTPEGIPVDGRGCPMSLGSEGGTPVPIAPTELTTAEPDASPQPVASYPQPAAADPQQMTLKSIYFGPDSVELSAEARATLDEVAGTLKGRPQLRVEIAGHTDVQGPPAYNLMLSQQRAEAARQYLVARGVDGDRLVSQGYGEFRPRDGGAARNRRVDFRLIVM